MPREPPPRQVKRGSTRSHTSIHPADPGRVYTLDPSNTDAAGHGFLGLEEMVVVTETGCRWLSTRQMTLPCLGDASRSHDCRQLSKPTDFTDEEN